MLDYFLLFSLPFKIYKHMVNQGKISALISFDVVSFMDVYSFIHMVPSDILRAIKRTGLPYFALPAQSAIDSSRLN